MMYRWTGRLRAAACALGTFAASAAFAIDEVRVVVTVANIDNRPQRDVSPFLFNAGQDVNLTVPNPYSLSPPSPYVAGDYAVKVRIMTTSATDSVLDDVGMVTITGGAYGSNEMKVLVANHNTLDFPARPDLDILAGAINLGGIRIVDQGGDPLNVVTVLAASVTGNIASTGGEVRVGRIFRLQAVNASLSAGGTISVPVSATSLDVGDTGPTAIGYIVASNSITGSITCDPINAGFGPAGINTVRVGPNASAGGISGRIVCPDGAIQAIKSSGPINITTTGVVPGIVAARIEYIYAGELAAGEVRQPTLVRDVNARIQCTQADNVSGVLRDMRVGGNLVQPVVVNAVDSGNTGNSALDPRGIWVRGNVLAPITITDRLQYAEISANHFDANYFDTPANITIGSYLKGRIEARGAAGELQAISIGRTPTEGWDIRNIGWNGYDTITYQDIPSVIIASRVRSVDAVNMHLVLRKEVEAELRTNYVGTLVIDNLVRGLIKGPVGGDPYVECGDVRFGQVRAYETAPDFTRPKVYCESFNTFDVVGDYAGTTYFKAVPAGRVARFGGKMENIGALQGGIVPGEVFVDDSASLQGQVVINSHGTANPNVPAYCNGFVRVELGQQDALFRAADTVSSDLMPTYTRAAAVIGGGAVGLAPFYLFDQDCLPINTGSSPPHVLLQSQFSQMCAAVPAVGVTLKWYGPVRTDLTTGTPIQLDFVQFSNGQQYVYGIPHQVYTATLKRGTESGFSRELHVQGNPGWGFSEGYYRVRPKTGLINGRPYLYCDQVDAPIAVQNFEYWFHLGEDCNCDGIADTVPCGMGTCPCPADFNEDGGVDGSDVEAFFLAWEAGGSEGDVSCDGGVDGMDVEAFFRAWEAGGC